MPIKYVPYVPEPVKGQAVLNFNRVLKYQGADDINATLQRGMPLYEMETKETVGDNADGNLVIRGECVSSCAYLKEKGIQVDLVYIDPPFASGADYAKKVYIRRNPKVAEAILKAEQELDIEELKTFEEKMYGDVWDKEKYLNWMYENLVAIKSVMNETASIYVHLDYHIGHYVKILLDEVFGEEYFKNEIVWKRSLPHNDPQRYGCIHDTIFYYTKSADCIFNQMFTGLSDEYIASHYNLVDETGRRYQLTSLSATGAGESRRFGEVVIAPPAGNHWRYSQENIDKLMEKGLIVFTSSGRPRFKRYLDTMSGPALQSIWDDVLPINSQALESENYATQKPEALLERIIKASSDEGMIVADFFGGSGVTAAVAKKLGRRFITSDIGINSVQTMRDRLVSIGAAFDVLEIKDGVSLYRNPVQTMDAIRRIIPGLKNEDGLDSFWEGSITTTQDGMVPVYVPNLMDSSSKLLDEVMINRIIHQAIPDLPAGVKKVIVYYIDITDKEAIERFIDEDDSTLVKIDLRDLKPLLDDVVFGDEVEYHIEPATDTLLGGYSVVIDRFLSDRVMQKIQEFNLTASQNASKKPYKPIDISDEGLELIEYLSLDCTAASGPWHSDSEIKIDKLGYVIKNGTKSKSFWDGRIVSLQKPLRLKIRNICGDETEWEIGKKYV